MKEIEKRAYGPDSSNEEIEMLKNRVSLLDETIIYLHEVPIMSEFEIEITSDEIGKHLSLNKNLKYIIINIVETAAPDARLRAKLRECYSNYINQIEHVAYFTGNNAILNLIAKYMVRTIGYKKYSFHKTKEQAMKAIKDEQNR